MAQKRNKPNKPDILTPEKNQNGKKQEEKQASKRAFASSKEKSSSAPIIDMTPTGKAKTISIGLAAGGVGGIMAGAVAGGVVFSALSIYGVSEPNKEPIQAEIKILETRIINLEAQEERVSAALSLIVDTKARIDNIEQQIGPAGLNEVEILRLDTATQTLENLLIRQKAMDTQLASLNERVIIADQLQPSQASLLRPTLLAHLNRALLSGQPYGIELDAIKQHFPEWAEVLSSDLAPYAQTGLARTSEIIAIYQRRLPALLVNVKREQADGIWSMIKVNLYSMLRIRRVSGVEGDDPHSILLRIDQLMRKMESGTYDLALFEQIEPLVHQLPTIIQKELTDWTAVVKARLVAERLLTELSNNINQIGLTQGTQ